MYLQRTRVGFQYEPDTSRFTHNNRSHLTISQTHKKINYLASSSSNLSKLQQSNAFPRTLDYKTKNVTLYLQKRQTKRLQIKLDT